MPCYTPNPEQIYESVEKQVRRMNKKQKETEDKLLEYKEYSMKIDAAMCAVLNELEQRGIAEGVIVNASRNGLIDIVGWWESHKKDDKARITKKLHSFSIDEQRLMLDMLKDQFNDK